MVAIVRQLFKIVSDGITLYYMLIAFNCIQQPQRATITASSRSSRLKRLQSRSVEKKLFLVFIGFLVFGILNQSRSTFDAGNKKAYQKALTDYFTCELFGHTPGLCNREDFERHTAPILVLSSTIAFAFVPMLAVVFITNWTNLKKCFGLKSDTDTLRQTLLHSVNKTQTAQQKQQLSSIPEECYDEMEDHF